MLHEKGKNLKKYPFRWKYARNSSENLTAFQVAISVPKRRVPKASDRNHIKRLIREALRQNKSEFEAFICQRKLTLSLLVVYGQSQALSYQEIEKQMRKSFRDLTEVIKQDENNIPIID